MDSESGNNKESPPVFSIPVRPPKKWDLATLRQHVRTGMHIELTTIPLYLFSIWSIIPDSGKAGTKARTAILRVVAQEMLHLALTGNLLRAIDGCQDLYDSSFMPKYPSKILYDGIETLLEPAGKDNLDRFVKIEAPYEEAPKAEVQKFSDPNSVDDYKSIGEFYKELETGLRELSDTAFTEPHAKSQFGGLDAFGGDMIAIRDLDTALKALTIIIDQGEGSPGAPDSHYHTFVGLYQGRKEWKCYTFLQEPETSKYSSDNLVYRLSLAFDAAYCYLLQTIQRVWSSSDDNQDDDLRLHLVRNMHAIMIDVLTPLANVLVQQKFKAVHGGLVHGGPCFQYYPPIEDKDNPPSPLKPADLFSKIQDEINDAIKAAQVQATKAALESILLNITRVEPEPNN